MKASTVIGVAVFGLMVIVLLNGARTEGPGSRGVPEGEDLPPFAVPLAIGGPDKDANVSESAQDGVPAACEVRGAGILNICELAERGPVALAFFATRSDRCEDQVDALDAAAPEGIQVAAVAIRGSQAQAAAAARTRGWELPVGWDRDGAVANAYAVAICPTITFARRGGEVVDTSFELLGREALERRFEQIRGAGS